MSALYRSRFNRAPSIISIENGTNEHENNLYAIFLIYQKGQIPWYVKNALDSLNEANINVIIVANHELTDDQSLYLKSRSKTIIRRDNSGFDIGAFRDVTAYFNSLNIDVDRIIYLNDSIYFFKSGLTDLFLRLIESTSDICAPFENWEIHYHVQSFCISLSGRIFRRKEFQEFWKNYLPVNSRLWAINKGEVGLSRAMLPLADTIDIIYTPNHLREHASALQTIEDRMNLVGLMPISIRIPDADIRSLEKSEFTRIFLSNLALRSQIHTGGFIYRKYNGCPIIKRDLLYRDQFTIYEIEEALIETGHEGHLNEILTDFRKKGKASQLPIIKRLQAASGII